MNDIRTGTKDVGFQPRINLDLTKLKKIQDYFCYVAKLYITCVDGHGNKLTEPSGSMEDWIRINQIIGEERLEAVFSRVNENSLEEQVIEETQYENVKLAAVAIKIDGRVSLVWTCCALIENEDADYTTNTGNYLDLSSFERKTSELDLMRALDLLRVSGAVFISSKMSLVNAEAESRRSKFSELEMSKSLKRIEATTEMVQLLESDASIEVILSKILNIVGIYLDISSAQVFKLHRDQQQVDVMVEWCNEGIISIFDQTRNIKRSALLYSEKPLVISSDVGTTQLEREELNRCHIEAFVAIPINLNGTISMYATFNECKNQRNWQIEEIKFMMDATKMLQSILVKRVQKNSLASSYASLEAILDNVGCGIYVRDAKSKRPLFANRILKSMFEKEINDATMDSLLESGKPAGSKSNYEINYIAKNRWYELHYSDLVWVDGSTVSLFSIYDITDKKVYQKRIEQQAYTDFLTGLYNRMCCERDLAYHIDYAKKNGKSGALLYLDLDDFKHINDGLGHQYGDVLLKAISHSLQRIEGISNTCYRMGGDEFVIIIPCESIEKSDKITDDIKNIFAKPWFLKDADYYCTMSMGIVEFPDEGDSVQDLIKKADIAMYEAKKSGKNRMAKYSNKIDSSSNRRLDMEKNMRDAAIGGYEEFEVYYQPIIDIQRDGNPCTGAEALIRWNSTELGFVPPSDFIPLAEYLGLINPIGNYVLKEACKACKLWNENGHPNYKVNVNLSVVQLLQADIVDIVAKTLQETKINPRNLTLEVTESLAINDMERMKEILSNIKKLGVRIALDDFGTGYSSLNHIREIPFDVIKVDQSFVTDIAEDSYSQSFIKMVGELASTIGVSICVEGIETLEQYKVLEGMKVRLIQGYYFDKPMPRAKFEEKYI